MCCANCLSAIVVPNLSVKQLNKISLRAITPPFGNAAPIELSHMYVYYKYPWCVRYVYLKMWKLNLWAKFVYAQSLRFISYWRGQRKREHRHCRSFFFFWSKGWEGEGGGYSTKFYMGRLRLEVQPLTLLYTIFDRKGALFVYLLVRNGTPFTYPF